jgi:adenylosuccinate synthase
MDISIILGLGFGDEGKGATVNSLCTDHLNTLVIRFNGGHQVGHTAVHNNIRHPFSNFGSGTLKGVPTYWSEYCTVNPLAVLKEGNVLREQGVIPIVFYNSNAMVTTPYDILYNLSNNTILNHGSVGVGFGSTIQRNEDLYHLYVRDLQFPAIRDEKLRQIKKYYFDKTGNIQLASKKMNELIEEFKSACDDLVKRFSIVGTRHEVLALLNSGWNLIFEGGQGIMLDQNYGFFPHVTRSNTTSKNAIEIINNYVTEIYILDTYYITRAYQTRHGNGFMSNEGRDISYIKINPNETNVDTGSQGIFRRTVLDLDLLKYAVNCDKCHNSLASDNHLVITCMDHVGDKIPATKEGIFKNFIPLEVGAVIGVRDVILSNSDKGFA